jgi:tetratricopeptide (TPR) repeat protein
MQLALSHYEAGRRADAEAVTRQVLAQAPNKPEALSLLGVLACEGGQSAVGLDLIGRALKLAPGSVYVLNIYGSALRANGQFEDAIAAYRQALRVRPDVVEVVFNLASTLRDAGHVDEALTAFARCTQLRPSFAEAHDQLGNALRAKGRLDEGIAAHRRAIALRPNLADAYNNLGNGLRDKGLFNQAIDAFNRATQIDPAHAAAYCNLGNALRDAGRLDDAVASCKRALELRPDYAIAFSNMGNALRDLGRTDEALVAFGQAVRLRPGMAELHYNLGNTLIDQLRMEEATAAFEEVIRLKPTWAEGHFHMGLTRLAVGDFGRGWPEYESRTGIRGFGPLRNFHQPQWDGKQLDGKTILLHDEQGQGDTIQFVRYVQMVAERVGPRRGGRIILGCQPSLVRLLAKVPDVHRIIAAGSPMPEFDVHCRLLSLPLAFGTDLATIPAPVPYLHAEANLSQSWAQKMGPRQPPANGGEIRVGLTWAGSSGHAHDYKRSLVSSQLAELAEIPRLSLYSIQKGAAAEQARALPPGMKLIDLAADLVDFADTAALIDNLDLVISVDTSVAHLAGAMGKPTWILLPYSPDWRWMLGRDDSPWYPTARLFRQKSAGDWTEVVRKVVESLKEWLV